MLILSGKCVAFDERDWEMNGKAGTSRKLTVRSDEGTLEVVTIPEELWSTLNGERDQVQEFGTDVEVGVRVILSAYEGQRPKVVLSALGVRCFDRGTSGPELVA